VRRKLVARFVQSLIVVGIVATISFFVIRLAPGDPFSFSARNMSLDVRDKWRTIYGFDRPLPEQYVRYVAAVARGELGPSLSKQMPVSEAIADALPRTLLLAGLALAVSLVLGIVIGALQAVKRASWFDRASSTIMLLFYSLPDFWAALMILLAFSYWWQIFPSGGIIDVLMYDHKTPWEKFVDRLDHLVLPLTAFVAVTLASIARYQRAAMLEVLPSDYIRTARAKGAPENVVVWRHALRTALTPMVTILGLMLPAFIGGAVFIEKIFGWPGLGLLAADAITRRDYFLVTATVIVGSVLVVIGNLISDLLQMALDPRTRE
jgi:peptide/nickel transport system permease protein